jgi:hypothetical protein
MPTAAELTNMDAGPFFVRSPFTILIDKAEKAPFAFTEIKARSFVDKDQRTYLPRTEPRYLGIGMGDYSLDGYQDRIAIERKSLVDFQGTLLGWEKKPDSDEPWDTTGSVDRRKRFKNELTKLAAMECCAIVVEASLSDVLNNAPSWGKRTESENAKYLLSTTIAWQQEFRGVPWLFLEDRRLAEITAFRILEQWWAREQRHAKARKRAEKRSVKRIPATQPLFV